MTPTDVKPPRLFRIPAGTKPSRCPCDAKIFWVNKQPLRAVERCHYLDKNVIISTPDAKEPTPTEDGAGFNHFVDCPRGQTFRRPTNA